MASIVSNLSVGLRRITPKDRAAIKKEIDSFNMPGSYSYVLERVLTKKQQKPKMSLAPQNLLRKK